MKRSLYFLVAGYFAFWARIVLAKWRPEIIVVTGSAGKTTVFYLLEAQLREQVEFAHEANSAFGIPFNILHLRRETYSYFEWVKLIILAPWMIFQKETRKKIYVVEADADRPKEGAFLAKLLKPSYVLVTNIYQTHAMNFDYLVAQGKFATPLLAITAEFLNFVKYARKQVYVNGDNQAIMKGIERENWSEKITNKIVYLQQADYLNGYQLSARGTDFVINGRTYQLPYLLPKEVSQGLALVQFIVDKLKLRVDESYQNLHLPGGRSQLLAGVKNTVLIDSSYNANLGSMRVMLELFEMYPAEHKWLVLGHMLEQGVGAEKEHENLAGVIMGMRTVERIILIGESNKEWTFPILQRYSSLPVSFYEQPTEALTAIKDELQGGETLLLKGAPFMEGMVEGLLADPGDEKFLVRREAVHRKKREKFYGKAAS